MMTYVRTPLTLLSPGWQHSVSSADGMNVYMMASAPVLLLSDRGRVVRARVSQEGVSDE
jgi:intracellular multiplication protein IcmK